MHVAKNKEMSLVFANKTQEVAKLTGLDEEVEKEQKELQVENTRLMDENSRVMEENSALRISVEHKESNLPVEVVASAK
ncbi:unnamed protein product [Cuscuta campestris]|uniref:Uncharacterized protein n=1 Tax=Cuscuta campestris TaxID=132261 RepID=A0A484KT69_9ASTE|nr:unnamed protein product [Cuscuta campestris]